MNSFMQRGVTALLGLILAGLTVIACALDDPTRPAGYGGDANVGTNGWTLNSTLVGPDRRIAVINGQHVREGEAFGNAWILRIDNTSVLIETADKNITLHLLPGTVNEQQ